MADAGHPAVSGSLSEVWEAIATGPGISSWYVPHTVEEREGEWLAQQVS